LKNFILTQSHLSHLLIPFVSFPLLKIKPSSYGIKALKKDVITFVPFARLCQVFSNDYLRSPWHIVALIICLKLF